MTSLISLDHELKAVKSELEEKVYQCKREQLEHKFSEFSEDELVMENAIKDAALTFEVVRNETKSIRNLKRKLDEVKEELGKDVAKSHGQLKDTLYKMKISKSCSASVHKYNAIMLEKKVEGSEMQLQMGLKKLRKIEIFQKELDTATTDLLSVLSTHQQRCVDRILKSPTPSNQNMVLPNKQSAQVDVVVKSIQYLREQNEKLKAELESMVATKSSGNKDSLVIQELENEVCQLKLQVFELQNEAQEREKTVIKSVPEESSEQNATETETEKKEDGGATDRSTRASYRNSLNFFRSFQTNMMDPPGKGAADDRTTISDPPANEAAKDSNTDPAVDPANEEAADSNTDSEDKDVDELLRIINSVEQEVDDIMTSVEKESDDSIVTPPVKEVDDSIVNSSDEEVENPIIVSADNEVDDSIINSSAHKEVEVEANDGSVDPRDEEDSYGFEDMLPSPVPMPKPIVDMEDKLAELELHDMGDIKLVQPDYDQLVLDQMRHEEELEEYAVQILNLKETISELEEENRELKGQIAFAEGEEESAEEIQQLESEVAMWRLKYEESAAGGAQVHRLRVELERTKAKSKKRIAVLQDDLQTLQKNGSDRIKNLIQKFKSFQEEGAARVQTLEAELEKSRAEVYRLQNAQDDDTEAETDPSDHELRHDQSDDEVDEKESLDVSLHSPECAGEDVTDGVDESEHVRSESDGYKTYSSGSEHERSESDGYKTYSSGSEHVRSESDGYKTYSSGSEHVRSESDGYKTYSSGSEHARSESDGYKTYSSGSEHVRSESDGYKTDSSTGSEHVPSECDGYKTDSTDGGIEETRILREQLEAMKKSMEEAEKRSGEEIKRLQDTIASMKMEREMKQEVISSLQEQLNATETALTHKTKSWNFPAIYSYGSPFDSDTD